jgi:hypothetical protein
MALFCVGRARVVELRELAASVAVVEEGGLSANAVSDPA